MQDPIQALQPLVKDGVLRACINLGNAVLARRDANGQPAGVTAVLAGHLARRLGAALTLIAVDTAAESVGAVAQGQADVGFFAVDPKRAEQIAFTPPYVLIEGWYMVRQDSPLTAAEQVDQPGRRIVVGAGSAYDLYLTREIRHAQIERAASSQAVVDTMLADGAEVAAGVRQQLELDAARLGGLRLLDNRFMVIRQAMGVSRQMPESVANAMTWFVQDALRSGLIDTILRDESVQGAQVAPLE